MPSDCEVCEGVCIYLEKLIEPALIFMSGGGRAGLAELARIAGMIVFL